MHRCLYVDEIVRYIAHELVAARRNATTIALACCCKLFEDPVLDALWGEQHQFLPLLKILPLGIWSPGGYSFERLPTNQEWARWQNYAQRIRGIAGFDPLSLLSSQVLSILQSRALSEPLLPNLQNLMLRFTPVAEGFIQFVPLFLSTRTTSIKFVFSGRDLYTAKITSMIATLPTLCPDLKKISFAELPKDLTITDAVSELVLNTKQNNLRSFHADSPLTEEACKVIFQHRDLCKLGILIDGSIALPTMVLPNLTDMEIRYSCGHNWLQGFSGASLGNLTSIKIHSRLGPIDDFLRVFKSVMLTTSIPATLSEFWFQTHHSWRPSHYSLLPFIQLQSLVIKSSCGFDCSSTMDDDTITDLIRAMPKLQLLHLDDHQCETPSGVTLKGLAAIACYCPDLSSLGIRFQVASLDPPEDRNLPYVCEPVFPRAVSGLRFLQPEHVRMPEGSTLVAALTLLHIFPHLERINSFDTGWEKVSKALYRSSQLARSSRAMLKSGI